MSRQSKLNILSWLHLDTLADAISYPDLVPIAAQSQEPRGDSGAYRQAAWSICQNRHIYRTRSELLGIGPGVMQPGDTAAILFGGSSPVILRARGDEWVFLGDTYIHHEDIALGREAQAIRSSGHARIETFRLR